MHASSGAHGHSNESCPVDEYVDGDNDLPVCVDSVEEINLQTRAKGPVPNAVTIRRFYCAAIVRSFG